MKRICQILIALLYLGCSDSKKPTITQQGKPLPADEDQIKEETPTEVGDFNPLEPNSQATLKSYFDLHSGELISPVLPGDSDFQSEFLDTASRKVKVVVKAPEQGRIHTFRAKTSSETTHTYLRAFFSKAAEDPQIRQMVLPKGTYTLVPDAADVPTQLVYFNLTGLKNVDFNFSESTIIMHRPGRFLSLRGCEQLRFRALRLQSDYRVASKARVGTANNQKHLSVLPAYLDSIRSRALYSRVEGVYESELFSGTRYSFKRLSPNRWRKWENGAAGYFDFNSTTGIYTPTATSILTPFANNQEVIIKHYESDAPAFDVVGGEDLWFQNIQFRSIPGRLYQIDGLKRGLLIRANHLDINEQDPLDFMASSSGAVQLSSSTGDVAIIQNIFKYAGDDLIRVIQPSSNITHLEGSDIRTRITDSDFSTTEYTGKVVEPLIFYDKKLQYRGYMTITEYLGFSNQNHSFKLFSATPAFDKEFFVSRPYRNNPRLIISNNTIAHLYGHAIESTSSSALIDHNTIDNISGNAICLCAKAADKQHTIGGAVNVRIFKNEISRVGFSTLARHALGRASRFKGAITVGSELEHTFGYFSPYYVHEGIHISENSIENLHGIGIQVSSSRGVLIQNNTLKDTNKVKDMLQGSLIERSGSGSIMIYDAKDIEEKNNSIMGTSSEPINWGPNSK
jgi:hypothetical protein